MQAAPCPYWLSCIPGGHTVASLVFPQPVIPLPWRCIPKPRTFTHQCWAYPEQLSVVWHCFISGIDANKILQLLKLLYTAVYTTWIQERKTVGNATWSLASILVLFISPQQIPSDSHKGMCLKVVKWVEPPLKMWLTAHLTSGLWSTITSPHIWALMYLQPQKGE